MAISSGPIQNRGVLRKQNTDITCLADPCLLFKAEPAISTKDYVYLKKIMNMQPPHNSRNVYQTKHRLTSQNQVFRRHNIPGGRQSEKD